MKEGFGKKDPDALEKMTHLGRRDFLRATAMAGGAALGGSLLTTGCGMVGPSIQDLENANLLPRALGVTNPARHGEIQGFASRTSINRGESISLFVHTADPNFTLEVFRVGWYGGAGVKSMLAPQTLKGRSQKMPKVEETTGLIECEWTNPFVLDVPYSADPSVWSSGIYVAKLTASHTKKQSLIIFVVRDDARPSDLLFQSSVTTFQAYNLWGGRSLYTDPRGLKVSFNRPYARGSGSGDFFFWENSMVQFLEREGYDVSYSTDVDTHQRPELLTQHNAFLSVGHDEYWSWQMRNAVEDARDAGVNLGFFAANVCYWQIRFAASEVTGDPNRTIICYKDASLDPMCAESDPAMRRTGTVQFRDAIVGRPEDALLGVMFDTHWGEGDFVVSDASHWIWDGAGVKNGHRIHGLVGYEADRMMGNAPPGTQRVGHSPYLNYGEARFSDMTTYQAASGAHVVATGTMQWNWGLSNVEILGHNFSSGVAQQATRNILKKFGALPDSPLAVK